MVFLSSLIKRNYLKLKNIIKLGLVTESVPDTGKINLAKVTYEGKTPRDMPVISPYGLFVNLPPDTLGLILCPNGNEANAVCIGFCADERLKDIASGEVAIGNPLTKSKIHFLADGKIRIEASNNADIEIITGGDVKVTANNVNIDAQKVNLGVGGNRIARLGDTVHVNTSTGDGTITSAGENTSI